MKDVIQHMLQVEDEAKSLVYQSEQQAAEIIEKHRRKAMAQVEEVRQAAQAESTKVLADARKQMDDERARRIAEIDEANRRYGDSIRPRIDEAVDLVIKRIVGK